MKKTPYLFMSRKSSHYRYYKKLVAFLGDDATLVKIKQFAFPRWSRLGQTKNMNLDELVESQVARKKVRHPIIAKYKGLAWLLTRFYKALECSRASYYIKYFSKHEIGTLVIWNGMKQPNRTPYEVAKYLGINVQLFENGLLPNTTVLDPKGVNALNSLPRNADFYLNWTKHEHDLKKQLVTREPHKNRTVNEQTMVLPEHYIFAPFQVPNDTQIICHSPWVESMEAFYNCLELTLSELPPETNIVIKEHPSWPRTFKHLHFKNKRILFANNNNTQQLIEQSQAVVTINSTVGIESLLLGKKVITLGNSFINIDGLVKHCESQQALNEALVNLDSWQCDELLRVKFLSYLEEEYLISQNWNQLTDENSHFVAVQQRLEAPYESHL